MNTAHLKFLTPALLALALCSCASMKKDAYDTSDPYGYPDAGYADEIPPSSTEHALYEQPPAYDEPAPDLSPAQPHSSSSSSRTSSGGRTHTVKSGETLSKISGRYGVKMSSVMQANQIKDPNKLRVGQKLKIPSR
ncbi:MAG TPA: LysM domain-containing protein [Luteolibacter sp.]|nr:LysM domain-containing protein [Luteolibacter sp.]